MKKFLSFACILFAAAALAGCTSFNASVPSAPFGAATKTALVPDIEVGGKVVGTASIKQILFFSLGDNNEYADGVNYAVAGSTQLSLPIASLADKAKAAAALRAVKDSGADVLVAPTYEIKTLRIPLLYQEVSATVTAYKGTIKGFHQLKDEHLN